ncbi:DUF3305 domain-containing protein [Plastorhodobacter daqingensis]|uniref:DUF3305 domain-containing protein n=1 Tax=Plastorhodobacter daqingensis TaxID=1387281 RepID=A0ABW2UKW9_9RHOB
MSSEGALRERVTQRLGLAVEVERRPAKSRWLAHLWRVSALRPPRPDLAPWTLLHEEGPLSRFHAGTAEILLHSADTRLYKDNIEAEQPSVYVVLRRGGSAPGWRLLLVTVDPSEAHAHADVGNDLVEALVMPPPILAAVTAFVRRHHVERREWKRRRDRPDPEALAARRGARRVPHG